MTIMTASHKGLPEFYEKIQSHFALLIHHMHSALTLWQNECTLWQCVSWCIIKESVCIFNNRAISVTLGMSV